MDRRKFVAMIGSALAAPLAGAQVPAGKRKLGILSPNPAPTPEQVASSANLAFLRKQGWIEGQNLVIERAYGGGQEDRLPDLAAELVRKRVDVIWALGPHAAIAAARATQTIPIVFWGVGFPVETGLIDSLARPGRNATGMAWFTGIELATKLIQFVREIAPDVRRLSTISVPTIYRTVAGGELTAPSDVVNAARSLGFEFQRHVVRQRDEFDAAFAAILKSRSQAVIVSANSLTLRETPRIVEFANGNRLISASDAKEYVNAGGLFSYGPDIPGTILASFVYVDKILRGARPADLPVEQPSRYELAVNLKTAKILGLKIPQAILIRADRVIE